MCGIAGIIGKIENGSEKIAKMLKFMEHRGKDNKGIECILEKEIYLGHQRLSIIDLSRSGDQPFYNEDRSILCSVNGEIYNYKELKEKYLKKHKFVSNSDSEVIIHLYEEVGEKVFSLLDGMFAISIVDLNKNITFLARDNFGIRPLFYSLYKNTLYFSSELKSIISVLPKWDFSEQGFYYLMNFWWIPAPFSEIENVFKLEPGYYLKFKDNKITKKRFFKLNSNIEKISYKDAVKKFYKYFKNSVKKRMIADVPVGVMLSGGVDSSAVAIESAKLTESLECFTAGFKNKIDSDEREFAKIMCKKINGIYNEVLVDPDEFLKNIDEIIYYLDVPIPDANYHSIFYISKAASKKGVKVLLCGDGADEILGGYNKYIFVYLLSKFPILKNIFKIFTNKLPARFLNYIKTNSLIELFRNMNKKEQKKLFISPLLNKFEIDLNNRIDEITNEISTNSKVKKLMWIDSRARLPEQLLLKVDKMQMSHTVEGRVPFLDKDISQFLLNLPDSYFFGLKRKSILKDAFKNILPDIILKRKKMGFSIPLTEWTREKDFFNTIKTSILSSEFIKKLFNRKKLIKFLDLHYKGKITRTEVIWSFYIWSRWENMIKKIK